MGCFVGREDRRFEGVRSIIFIFSMAFVSWLWWPGTSAGAEELALRVESKVVAPSPSGEGKVVTYTFRNVSEKTITAWVFGCVLVSQLGDGSIGTAESDSYMEDAFAKFRKSAPDPETSQLIRPGGILKQTVPFPTEELDGPYAAKSCDMVALVFADATSEGDSKQIDSILERRVQIAVDAFRAREALTRRLRRGTALPEALEELGRSEERAADDRRGANAMADQVLSFAGRIRSGGMPQDAAFVLQNLEDYYRGTLLHLPAQKRALVAREVQP